MARSKRFLYSSGVHCPLVVRIPEKMKHLYPGNEPGTTVDRLVSFVDMPKTWLSLAGAEIPDTFQGTVFLGNGIEPEPKYHLGFRERADERLDHVRLMRTGRYSYHKNYYPFAPCRTSLGLSVEGSTDAGLGTASPRGRRMKSRASSSSHGHPKSFRQRERLRQCIQPDRCSGTSGNDRRA